MKSACPIRVICRLLPSMRPIIGFLASCRSTTGGAPVVARAPPTGVRAGARWIRPGPVTATGAPRAVRVRAGRAARPYGRGVVRRRRGSARTPRPAGRGRDRTPAGHGQSGDHDVELPPGDERRSGAQPAGLATPARRAASHPVSSLVTMPTRASSAASPATGGILAGSVCRPKKTKNTAANRSRSGVSSAWRVLGQLAGERDADQERADRGRHLQLLGHPGDQQGEPERPSAAAPRVGAGDESLDDPAVRSATSSTTRPWPARCAG